MDVRLVRPSTDFKRSYLDMMEEWNASGEKLVPFILEEDTENFEGMVALLEGYKLGKGIPSSFVEHSTFWLADRNDRLLGAINIRHRLNERLKKVGGHIGYGVRPSERRKGYASKMLQLALLEARKLGLSEVLLTCSKENTASAKTILNNGGRLDSEQEDESGGVTQRYWIRI